MHGPRQRGKILRVLLTLVSALALIGSMTAFGGWAGQIGSARADSSHRGVECDDSPICTEVSDPAPVFGKNYYVGHDEPSMLFYSDIAGSGNHQSYQLTLPKDPSPANPDTPGKSYNFQLHVAFWFGMAMCDTQSYPEQLKTCTPDSDSNIVDPANSARHPGMAFTEMQFYPPGWAKWPAGLSCDPTKWCAALNIDSLSEDPVHGTTQNQTCASQAGTEYVNFAFITKNGQTQAPPNPVQSTLATYTPDPSKDLFMNQGDRVTVSMHDTAHGLQVVIADHTTGQTGSMTASAANGFGQVKYDPTGTSCQNIPYDFHPMYSTSSPRTRVTWAAHSYNISFADEIGHYDYCSAVGNNGSCSGNEGIPNDRETADGDDNGCYPASASSLVKIGGCLGTNTGYDGYSYQPLWPDGYTALHPTPIQFSSPTTGPGDSLQYNNLGFEVDTPRIEDATFGGYSQCDRNTGTGCTLLPETDDGQPVAFYPWFSSTGRGLACRWQLGNSMPNSNDWGGIFQYGALLNLTYTNFGTNGTPTTRYNDYRQILGYNPCPQL